jgi:hypothetical protein
VQEGKLWGFPDKAIVLGVCQIRPNSVPPDVDSFPIKLKEIP